MRNKIKFMKNLLLFFTLLFSQISIAQISLKPSGYYGDLGYGINSEYHLSNIKSLLLRANLDTSEYELVEFITNSNIKFLTETQNISICTMDVIESEILSFEKRFVNNKENNPKEKKIYVIFYFQSYDRKKTTYYFYRYG